jgi:hypothetical protein
MPPQNIFNALVRFLLNQLRKEHTPLEICVK